MEDVPKTTASPLLNTLKPHFSGRIFKEPNQFMFLGESIFDEYDLDPNNYNEAISDKYLENW